jgi:hypothetical protein
MKRSSLGSPNICDSCGCRMQLNGVLEGEFICFEDETDSAILTVAAYRLLAGPRT